MPNYAEKTVQLMAGFNSQATGSGSYQDIINFPMFSGQSEPDYQVISFDEGEFIFKEGEAPRGLYVLKSGCVKMYVNRDNTRGRTASPEYVTKLISPNEVFGYKAIVKGSTSQSFAKAVKKTTVWLYDTASVIKLLSQMNPLVKTILDQAVEDITTFEKTSQFHYLASVQERIAYQLVVLSDRFGVKTARGTSINLKLTRNDFAQLASTINESLSRHLTEFKTEGLIDLNGKEIIILDREKLALKSGNF